MKLLGDCISVPGNASRSFRSEHDAQSQPRGIVQFGWERNNPYLRNVHFDSRIVSYDSSYCTSVYGFGGEDIPTLEYFPQIVELLGYTAHVTDVGCGQGEFVNAIRKRGINAIGFDPVLRQDSEHLSAKLWVPKESPKTNLIVMRCVLPHIPAPWDFLDQIATHQKSAVVLVEFQKLEWILQNRCWYQFCHDHVNQFSMFDFQSRYEVLLEGGFANDEWGWVLFNPNSRRRVIPYGCPHTLAIKELFEARSDFLSEVSNGARLRYVWGAAAKGSVLSDACHQVGRRPAGAVDANPYKWDQFLEGSGVKVIAPATCGDLITSDSEVLVANPNHLTEVKKFLEPRGLEVRTPIGI